MEWKSNLHKKHSGEIRKQFSSWTIPKDLRESFGIIDGLHVVVKLSIESFVVSRTYKVTSGGEFRLPNDLAEKIESITKTNKTEVIRFSIGGIDDVYTSFEEMVKESLNDDSVTRKKRLRESSKKPKAKMATVIVYERNPDVVAEVLNRANGKCERCGKAAPFLRKSDGSPYLEVHHKIRLADSGDDIVENAIALCPNCHRQEHYG